MLSTRFTMVACSIAGRQRNDNVNSQLPRIPCPESVRVHMDINAYNLGWCVYRLPAMHAQCVCSPVAAKRIHPRPINRMGLLLKKPHVLRCCWSIHFLIPFCSQRVHNQHWRRTDSLRNRMFMLLGRAMRGSSAAGFQVCAMMRWLLFGWSFLLCVENNNL